VGSLAIKLLPEIRSSLEIQSQAQWYHFLPVDCASYVVTYDSTRVDSALFNLCHHLRALRSYVSACVYFIALLLRFDDPRLLACTKKNLENGPMHIDKNLYLIRLAKGTEQDKMSLFAELESAPWANASAKEVVATYVKDYQLPNPTFRTIPVE